MNKINCPNCSYENNEDRVVCWKCGINLHTPSFPNENELTLTQGDPSSSQYTKMKAKPNRKPPSVKKTSKKFASLNFRNKYEALEDIANLCHTVSLIFIALGGIGTILGLITIFNESRLGSVVSAIAFLLGVSGYIIYKVIAEGISVIIDIEMNTRQTATYTKMLLEDRENG